MESSQQDYYYKVTGLPIILYYNIQTNIAKLNGVECLLVSLASKNATVSYDKMVITVEELCTAIGFEASCEGMTAEVQGAENKGEDLDDNRNAITVIPSSDSDGAESDNILYRSCSRSML